MNPAQMEKNYGRGYSMLKKMGFKGGGLGRREDGIANPIDVRVRRKGEALQDEGEIVGQDLHGREPGGGRQSVEEILSNMERPEARSTDGWKRTRGEAKRPKN